MNEKLTAEEIFQEIIDREIEDKGKLTESIRYVLNPIKLAKFLAEHL